MYYVYIITNKRKNVLYIGVTSNLFGRIRQHRSGKTPGFTKRYNIKHLLYYEEFKYVYDAIAREKQLKRWKRSWKEDLIRILNTKWEDLAEDWYDRDSESSSK